MARTVERVPLSSTAKTLRTLINERAQSDSVFSASEMLAIAREVSAALMRYHCEGICGLDIRPENIRVTQKNRFAPIVCTVDCEPLPEAASAQELLAWAQRTGAVNYLAPEVLQDGVSPDPRADQYALAVILYELLTGTVPDRSAGPLFPWLDGVSHAVSDALRWALSPDPDLRYPDMIAFRDALDAESIFQNWHQIEAGAPFRLIVGVVFVAGLLYLIVNSLLLDEEASRAKEIAVREVMRLQELENRKLYHRKRFVSTSAGVCDDQAELYWAPVDSEPMPDCPAAVRHCEGLGDGWRVPTAIELSLLYGPHGDYPREILTIQGDRRVIQPATYSILFRASGYVSMDRSGSCAILNLASSWPHPGFDSQDVRVLCVRGEEKDDHYDEQLLWRFRVEHGGFCSGGNRPDVF